MDINDYLINLTGKDWPQLLRRWTPPLPADFSLWIVNRLGELIVVDENEKVYFMQVGTGVLHSVADNRQQFAQRLDLMENADVWLRISLVDACSKANMRLADHECYGFKVPPVLQGQYAIDNLQPTLLDKHYSLLAHLVKQEDIYWAED